MTFRSVVWTCTLALALALAGAARAEDGAAVYKAQCAKCHGDTGASDTSAGQTLKVPAIKGDAKIAAASTDDLVKKVSENDKHKGIVKKISAAELAAAVGEVKRLAAAK